MGYGGGKVYVGNMQMWANIMELEDCQNMEKDRQTQLECGREFTDHSHLDYGKGCIGQSWLAFGIGHVDHTWLECGSERGDGSQS